MSWIGKYGIVAAYGADRRPNVAHLPGWDPHMSVEGVVEVGHLGFGLWAISTSGTESDERRC